MVSVNELDLASFVGRPVDEARSAVVAAGGTTRTVHRGEAVTADFVANRVTLLVEDDRVVDRPVIG
jgi:hypothetical protein